MNITFIVIFALIYIISMIIAFLVISKCDKKRRPEVITGSDFISKLNKNIDNHVKIQEQKEKLEYDIARKTLFKIHNNILDVIYNQTLKENKKEIILNIESFFKDEYWKLRKSDKLFSYSYDLYWFINSEIELLKELGFKIEKYEEFSRREEKLIKATWE